MIIPYYVATCDKCGKLFYDVALEEFVSMIELKTALKEYGWEHNGSHCLCDECKDK